MNEEGWIKIHRRIMNSWIWEDEAYLKAWLTILLKVNYNDREVTIGSKKVMCHRGESFRSLPTWAKVFGHGWTVQRVRTFFALLKDNTMINTKSELKTTRLSVLNYDSYQNMQHDKNTITTEFATPKEEEEERRRKEKENKKKKKDPPPKNEKKKKKPSAKDKPKDYIDQIVNLFVEAYGDYEIVAPIRERNAASKILELYKKEFPLSNSNEMLEILSDFFYACVNIDDPWLNENMSLHIIVSQYNKIKKILRNGRYKSKVGTSPKELADITAKNFAIDYAGSDTTIPPNKPRLSRTT